MENEKRRLKRVHLIYYLRIFDSNTGVIVGHLVDITTQGIMLISEEPVPMGKDYSFRMHLPATIIGREKIEFSAHCLWCKKDINPDFLYPGIRLRQSAPKKRRSSKS